MGMRGEDTIRLTLAVASHTHDHLVLRATDVNGALIDWRLTERAGEGSRLQMCFQLQVMQAFVFVRCRQFDFDRHTGAAIPRARRVILSEVLVFFVGHVFSCVVGDARSCNKRCNENEE